MTSPRLVSSWIGPLGAVAAVALGTSGCDSGIPGFHDPDHVELGDIVLEQVSFENDRGETIQALYAVPDRSAPMPAVIVLHGSGGLMDPPNDDDEEAEMGTQFEEWAEILYNEGYAVLMPDSFASRGFLEWNDAPDELDKTDRLIMRVYDTHAALAFACAQPEIDCDRVAVMGFSNGGSAAAFAVHDGVDALAPFAALEVSSQRNFAVSVAYYPGCGFDGLLSTTLDDPAQFYRPTVPVYVQHGDNDSLYDDCEDRLAQTEMWVETEGLDENPFHMYVYDAGHSFDSDPGNSDEREARLEARALTLDILADAL